jgi:hypothetical protein
VLRVLLILVPSLASVFRFPGITSITLNDIPSKSFEVFVGWLRYEYLDFARNLRKLSNHTMPTLNFELMTTDGRQYHDGDRDPIMWDPRAECLAEHAEVAIHLYIFANRYEILRLRLDAIDRLVWCLNRFDHAEDHGIEASFIGTATLVRAWRATSQNDPIRKLLCEGFSGMGDHSDETFMELPKELLVSLLHICKAYGFDDFGTWRPCEYHGHDWQRVGETCVVRVQMEKGMEEN